MGYDGLLGDASERLTSFVSYTSVKFDGSVSPYMLGAQHGNDKMHAST